MPLQEIVSQEDLMLYEIMRNPKLFGEFVNNFDRLDYEEPFEFTWYQDEILLDFNQLVSICCGRAVGKTVALSFLILWIMINNLFPDDYIVYTVPGKAHLEPVFTTLVRLLRTNGFLKHFIASHSGVNNSDFTILLLNQSKLLCRIAGQTGTGVSIIGLHAPFEIVDESGYYPWGTWVEFQPTFNNWTSGSRRMVSGVPTGIREKSVCYYADQQDSNFSKHRVSALQNPRFTEQDNQDAIIQYGGEDSDDYIHLVLGQHGKPLTALFDRSLMDISNYPIYKIENLNGTKFGNDLTFYIERLAAIPGLPHRNLECFFGIDLGYTEPTAIFILYTDEMGRIKFHAKVKLTNVSYPIQEKIIDYLDSKFNPIFLGMDEGNTGKSVRQHLMEDLVYTHKDYPHRIQQVDFSGNIILGIDTEGKEIKNKTKPFATSVLQEWTNNHKIVYSSTDLEMITELERMTYTHTPSGEIVYRTLTEKGGKRGEDHYTSALLCATMGYYTIFESLTRTKKVTLFKAGWIRSSR